MFVAVKNKSPALQGVDTLNGTVWLKPGSTRTIEVEDTLQIERLPFLEFTVSKDGVPVGDLPPPSAKLVDKALKAMTGAGELPEVSMKLTKPALIAIAKKERVEFETDDNKADLIRKITAAREAA